MVSNLTPESTPQAVDPSSDMAQPPSSPSPPLETSPPESLSNATSRSPSPSPYPRIAANVCVVGAGAAGLCAARHIAAAGLHCTVFEQTGNVGGTWVFGERVGVDQFGLPVHSSMYRYLRTNIPKEIMSYPDFPFPKTGRSYATHAEVLAQLRRYADHFDLHKHIQLFHHVCRIAPIEGTDRWSVKVKHLRKGVVRELEFDAVMVCNGHYSKPAIPEIPGIESFKGKVMHSHDYKDNSSLRGLNVVTLGASASGIDISLEAGAVANKVYVSHNLPRIGARLLPNMVQVPGIAEATATGFKFRDGSTCEADVLILCTGYQFNFPFLAPECGVTVENNRVMPMYRHMVHRDRPTMAFIGIPITVIPLLLFHYQVRYFVNLLCGVFELPSKQDMNEEMEDDLKLHMSRFRPHQAHKMEDLMWDYMSDLATTARFTDDMWPVVRSVYHTSETDRVKHVLEYRNVEYTLKGRYDFYREHHNDTGKC